MLHNNGPGRTRRVWASGPSQGPHLLDAGISGGRRARRPAADPRSLTRLLACDIARRAVEGVFNDGDLDLADLFFTPDYVNHGGLITDLVRGPEAIRISVALFRKAFPCLHITIASLTALRGKTVVHWIARGSPADGLDGSGPGLVSAGLRGATHLRFHGSKIAESWTYWDQPGVLASLGVIPG